MAHTTAALAGMRGRAAGSRGPQEERLKASTQTHLPSSRAVKWPQPPPRRGGEVFATVRRPQALRSLCSRRRRYSRPPTPPRRECISGGLCDCPCGQGWVSSATASRPSPQQLQPPPLLPHGRWSCRPAPAPTPTPPPPAPLPLKSPGSARGQSALQRRTERRLAAPSALALGRASLRGADSASTRFAQNLDRRGPHGRLVWSLTTKFEPWTYSSKLSNANIRSPTTMVNDDNQRTNIYKVWCITLIDLQMLNHLCSPGINPT
ncbi:histone-lysine N-methyltransferase 2B-like [Ursus arctos]|uniref:histone-lysine N-methyltransferase 2B-like n=1 Tax=Ursus arctos TaxID=9644 RepID=UPI002548D3D4|nr:histone-lysine N-methyltransferase 2B-like [Ursus arctos]